MSANHPERINALWTVFLLGTLFHTDLGLMPLFHGQSVALSDAHGTASGILWLMLAFFTLPMIAIIATTFTHSKQYRVIHFGLTILYSVLNFLHVTLDLMDKRATIKLHNHYAIKLLQAFARLFEPPCRHNGMP